MKLLIIFGLMAVAMALPMPEEAKAEAAVVEKKEIKEEKVESVDKEKVIEKSDKKEEDEDDINADLEEAEKVFEDIFSLSALLNILNTFLDNVLKDEHVIDHKIAPRLLN